MAKTCAITGKKVQFGGGYRNRVRATKFQPIGSVKRKPNVRKVRVYVPEVGRTFLVNLSAKGLKTLRKIGPYKALKKAGVLK